MLLVNVVVVHFSADVIVGSIYGVAKKRSLRSIT